MIRYFYLATFILVASAASAQFVPNNGQAFQFMPSYNPAFAGVESFHDVKVSYRYQWSGFGNNAPKFMNLSYSVRLKQPLDLTYNAPRSSYTTSPENYPHSKTLIHGMNINVFNESIGPIKRTGGGLNYSFNYSLSKKIRLAGGVGGVFESQKIGIGEITVDKPDSFYDQLLKNGSSQTTISARAGLLLYGKSFYLGVSYLPLYRSVAQAMSTETQDPFYKASIQAGVSFQSSPDFAIKPSVMALLQADGGLQIDYNVKAYIQQRVWLGISYRDTQAFTGMAGFNISNALSAAYSYELSTGGLKQFSDGSHEFVIGLRINNFKRENQFTW